MKYTIDNPKEVTYWDLPEEKNFTGVVRSNQETIAYYLNGNLHREDGPAVIYKNGNIEHYQHNKRHREDGPAVIWKRWSYYYKNGKRHRTDDPAVIYADGTIQYWVDNKHLQFHSDKELQDYLILRMFK